MLLSVTSPLLCGKLSWSGSLICEIGVLWNKLISVKHLKYSGHSTNVILKPNFCCQALCEEHLKLKMGSCHRVPATSSDACIPYWTDQVWVLCLWKVANGLWKVKCLGPCHLHGRCRWRSWLLDIWRVKQQMISVSVFVSVSSLPFAISLNLPLK